MLSEVLHLGKKGALLILTAWSTSILSDASQNNIENLYGNDGTGTPSFGAENEQDPQLHKLIARLQDKDSYERQRAAIALGNLGNVDAVEPLIHALKDEDVFVRDFAVRSLGDLGDSGAVEPLILAMKDESLLVRRSAAEALGNIGDARGVEPLIKAVRNENSIVRRAAVEALGNIGDARAVEPLIEVLRDGSIYIRDGAVDALTKIGKPALPELVKALCDWRSGPRILGILKDLTWQPSSNEERIWVRVAERNGQSLLDDWETAKRVFMDGLKSGDSYEVQNVVFALIGIGRDDMIGELVNILQEKGTVTIAKAYLNSSNDALRNAAREWAKKNGADIDTGDQIPVVEWGGIVSS